MTALASDKKFVFGICYDDSNRTNEKFGYPIGVECEEDAVAPVGFREKVIPARTWAMFPCLGAMPDLIQATWDKIYREFFPNAEYRSTRDIEIEAYPDGDMETPDYNCEIWISVEKQ